MYTGNGNLEALKTRIQGDVKQFLEKYIVEFTNYKWFMVLGEGQERRAWAVREAASLSQGHPDLLVSAQFREKGGKAWVARWWTDLRKKMASAEELEVRPERFRVVWITRDTFVDPAFAAGRRAAAKMNTILEIEAPEVRHDLKRVVTSWFRLRRTFPPGAISTAMMENELCRVAQLRSVYARCRGDERVRKYRKTARTDPAKIFRELEETTSYGTVPPATNELWLAMHIYAERRHSRFHRAVLDLDKTLSLVRLAGRHGRGPAVRDQAMFVDFHLRLIPAGMYDPELRENVAALVRDRSIPNRRAAQILARLVPQSSETLSGFAAVLHDLREVMPLLSRLPVGVYVDDLLNALKTRSLHEPARLLGVIAATNPEVRERILAGHPRSLRAAADSMVACESAELIEIVESAAAQWGVEALGRLATNALSLGAVKELVHLLGEMKGRIPVQTLPARAVEAITAGSTMVTVEFTNMTCPAGWLAMALPTICVPFACHDHLDHYKCDGGYLCVYENERLVMGGYLVVAGDVVLLNNLQGRLGAAKRRVEDRRRLARAIGKVLSALERPVLMRKLNFNALSLPEELDLPERERELDLPDIRLDNPSCGNFYVYEASA